MLIFIFVGFIDKKERIIDANLTFYGRELLSKGILSFKYFELLDTEAVYSSSSFDFDIESGPVLESIDNKKDSKPLFTNNFFSTNYPLITPSLSGSFTIMRQTDASFDSDPVLTMLVPTLTTIYSSASAISSRVSALSARSAIVDKSQSISFNRVFNDNEAIYEISVFVSESHEFTITDFYPSGAGRGMYFFTTTSSIAYSPILASGSSFGISDDNMSVYSQSSEKEYANTFFEIIKVTSE